MSDANPRFELVPLDPELAGPFAFDGEKPLRIGRDPESEIVLPYPSVSRRHAQIRFEDDRCLLLDVGSRHGTYLNGQQIETGTVVQVGHGDRLAFPPHDYRVQLAGGEDVGDGAIVELDDASGDDGQVEQISNRELNQLAARRLELLMDRAGAISEARDQEELVECVLEILL
ncbi:MAG: FHA domain-containing protein, partial [Proteobacteria bacterium]|nr:FHA domain-containing protein [Pseudomonadota bacterium]